jgi:phage major head subunit gpT-like protein
MPAPLISQAWADALEPGIREWFWLGYNRRQTLRDKLYNVIPSIKDTEHYEMFGAIATDAWNNLGVSGRATAVGYDRGYKANIQNGEFGVELPIRRTFLEDNLYSNILNPAMMLGDSAALKMEIDAASVFNNATTAGVYAGPDAVALASASHPNGPDVSGTQSNAGSLTLTPANIETSRLAMWAYTDDKGGLIGATPNTLLVPPALEYAARQSVLSINDPTTANRADNPRAGAYNIIMWPFLTSSTRWLLIDSNLMKQKLIWQERIPLDIHLKQEDTSVFATWIARMRYGYGFTDWRWCYVNN